MHDPETYCREIEAYLCRKNDGHLIRIVGPAFEQVARWAEMGVPIKVAQTGVDRYFERYYRKGPRRRPVRIEFCEADVLDAFDDWRRAVGVSLARPRVRESSPQGEGELDADSPGGRARGTLSSHIERAIARLTSLLASSSRAVALAPIIEQAVRDLDALAGLARRARGDAREAVIARLAEIDQCLAGAATTSIDDVARGAAEAEALEALAPFRDRMDPEAYSRARTAAFERAVREHFGLPTLGFR